MKSRLPKPSLQPLNLEEAYARFFKRIPLEYAERFIQDFTPFERRGYEIAKRLFDIMGAAIITTLTFCLYPFIYLSVWLEDGRPVFRKEMRIGKDGVSFVYFKFRSMRKDTEVKWLENKDKRVTRVGRVLRRTRLDELPQLWSVLKGDLSLVGPRPDIIDFYPVLKESIPHYDLRYRVKPGMTGWAQVNQPIQPASIEQTKERFEYDLYYLKYRSLWLDTKILLRTFFILIGIVSKDPSSSI